MLAMIKNRGHFKEGIENLTNSRKLKMERLCLLSAFTLMGLGTTVLLLAQEHSPVVPGAPETAAKELHEMRRQGKKMLVIDVRSAKEYAEGHVPGAMNIPLEELSKKIAETKLPKDIPLVTVCEHGGRSSRAVGELQKLSFKTSSFCKFDSWKKEGYKIEKGSPQSEPTPRVYRFYCHHTCLTYIETTDLNQICEHCDCAHHYGECMKGD